MNNSGFYPRFCVQVLGFEGWRSVREHALQTQAMAEYARIKTDLGNSLAVRMIKRDNDNEALLAQWPETLPPFLAAS